MAYRANARDGARRGLAVAGGVGLIVLGAYSWFAALVLLVVGGTDLSGFVSDWGAIARFASTAVLGYVLVRVGTSTVRDHWTRNSSDTAHPLS